MTPLAKITKQFTRAPRDARYFKRDILKMKRLRKVFSNFPNKVIVKITPSQEAMLKSALDRKVPLSDGSLTSIRDLIDTIRGKDSIVLLKGGVVRDIVAGVDVLGDVDVVYYGITFKDVQDRLSKRYGQLDYANYVDAIGLLTIGEGLNSLDATRLSMEDECQFDSYMNSLLLDFRKGCIIDVLGKGIRDARINVWRIPCSNHQKWLKYTRISLWRMIKFKFRGFVVPDNDATTIYKHFYEHAESLDINVWRRHALGGIPRDKVVDHISDMVKHIDDLHAKKLLNFTGLDMLMTLLKMGTLVPWSE